MRGRLVVIALDQPAARLQRRVVASRARRGRGHHRRRCRRRRCGSSRRPRRTRHRRAAAAAALAARRRRRLVGRRRRLAPRAAAATRAPPPRPRPSRRRRRPARASTRSGAAAPRSAPWRRARPPAPPTRRRRAPPPPPPPPPPRRMRDRRAPEVGAPRVKLLTERVVEVVALAAREQPPRAEQPHRAVELARACVEVLLGILRVAAAEDGVRERREQRLLDAEVARHLGALGEEALGPRHRAAAGVRRDDEDGARVLDQPVGVGGCEVDTRARRGDAAPARLRHEPLGAHFSRRAFCDAWKTVRPSPSARFAGAIEEVATRRCYPARGLRSRNACRGAARAGVLPAVRGSANFWSTVVSSATGAFRDLEAEAVEEDHFRQSTATDVPRRTLHSLSHAFVHISGRRARRPISSLRTAADRVPLRCWD